MKKQIKQKQDDTQAKQNSNSNSDEAPSPVSEDTKQKLVKQYRDRAETSDRNATPSRSWDENIGGHFDPDDYLKNGPEYGWPQNKNIDVAYRPSGETVALEYDPNRVQNYNPVSVNYPEGFEHANPGWTPRGEAMGNTASWQGASDGSGIDSLNYSQPQRITLEQLQNIVNAMSNDAAVARDDSNLKPNPLYGYGDAPRDFFSRYDTPAEKPEGYSSVYQFLEDEGLDDWVNNSGIADSGADRMDSARAFLLMQNMNDYDRQRNIEKMAQQYRDQQLYGDALTELMAQQQAQNNNRSLVRDAIQEARHQQRMDDLARQARQRNITGSAVW